jgi:RHS repeat-associated protein
MDRLLTRSDPLGRQENYRYDSAGNLTQFTDRRGKLTAFQYDALNRSIFSGFGQSGASYESTVGYTYDAGNRLTQTVDSITGTITRGYDGLGHLTSETTPQGSVTYTYDAAGRRATMTTSSQSIVNYSYDTANRVTQITQGSSAVSFGYDAANRRTSLTLPNGVIVSYGYDVASQLTGLTYSLNAATLGNLTYGYDLAGRRRSVGGSYASTGLPNPISSVAYDAANELMQWGTATPIYDANGNMVSDGTNSFSWNARNQLASMNMIGDSFQYDPFGRRTAKAILGTTTNYLYDGLNPMQELSGSTVTANLLTGLGVDERFTRTDSSGTADFLTDVLGSTLALTNSSGSSVAQYTYEPFGNTAPAGSSSSTYQYAGRENDGTGLYQYRARYYSPQTGRFLSEDPLGFAGGDVNLYAYGADSPTNFTDPFGTTITVNGNGANSAYYQQAISYLTRDPGMAAIINDLIRSSTNYNIDFNGNDDDHYDPSTHTVAWDPNSALRTTNNECQTPALGLGHEMAHADAPWWAPWVGWIPWPAYDNLEERRVITGSETRAANTLGEGTRTDHGGTPFTVPTPTSTTSPLAGRGCGCRH